MVIEGQGSSYNTKYKCSLNLGLDVRVHDSVMQRVPHLYGVPTRVEFGHFSPGGIFVATRRAL